MQRDRIYTSRKTMISQIEPYLDELSKDISTINKYGSIEQRNSLKSLFIRVQEVAQKIKMETELNG